MPILEIGGRRVEVGQEFLALSPEEQAAEVDEIEASFGAQSEPEQGPGTGFGEFAQREAMQPETPELRRDIDVAKVQAGFEALPTWQKPFRAAADVASVYGAGATLGFSDHLAALASGKTVDEERAITQQARDRMGWAAPVAEIGGAISSIPAKGIGLVRNIPALTSASGGLARAGNTAARTGAFAAEGAALGTAGAIGYGNDPTTGAAVGAALGPVGQAVGSAAGKVAGGLSRKPAQQSVDEIKDLGHAAYAKADAAGLIVKPSWTNELAREVREQLTDLAWEPRLTQKPLAVIEKLDEMLTGNVTLKDIENLRRLAGNIGGEKLNDFERLISRKIINKVDKHLDRLDNSHILTGNKTEGLAALKDARRLWSTAKKAELIEEAMENARQQAARSGTGGNLDNAIRQQFSRIHRSKNLSRGFSGEEKEVMRKIVMGSTKTQDRLRLIGRLAPNTGGLSLLLHGGAAMSTGGLTLLPGIAGVASKATADRMTQNNVYGLARLIRQNGLTPGLAAQVKKMPRARRQRLNRVLQGWNVTGAEVEP